MLWTIVHIKLVMSLSAVSVTDQTLAHDVSFTKSMYTVEKKSINIKDIRAYGF